MEGFLLPYAPPVKRPSLQNVATTVGNERVKTVVHSILPVIVTKLISLIKVD